MRNLMRFSHFSLMSQIHLELLLKQALFASMPMVAQPPLKALNVP